MLHYLVLTPNQLGKVLRGYRKSKGLTQAEAAKAGGLLPKTISSLEQMPERATVESLFRLLSALNVEILIRNRGAQKPKSPRGEW